MKIPIHHEAEEELKKLIDSERRKAAREALLEITGEEIADAVLSRMFPKHL